MTYHFFITTTAYAYHRDRIILNSVTWLFLTKESFTKKQAPYFHVQMVPLYKIFIVERKAVFPDQ